MEVLIKSVEIVDKPSPLHRKTRNILISNGIIKEISSRNIKASKVVNGSGMFLSLGWFDLRAHFCDPGFEYREDLESGCEAAVQGGFTDVLLQPNTEPVVESKNEVAYLLSGNKDRLTQVHVTGSVTRANKGRELTEMIDLHHAGAVAFSDGIQPLWHTDVFGKALQYLKMPGALLINRAEDQLLSAHGQMNEGITSTKLGMQGIPKLSEELMVARDLSLLEYHGGRLHLANVSSEVSLQLIKAARKKGLEVTCDVAAHQLLYNEHQVMDFDTNFKVNPPLRDKKTINVLRKALEDRTIDVLVSDHQPHDEEGKKLEFDLAAFGIIGIQEMPAFVSQLSQDIDLGTLLESLTYKPRSLLNLAIPQIKKGQPATLTLFDPKRKWVLNDASNRSKSRNSPNFGKQISGKAMAVFNNGKQWIDPELLN